MTLFCSLDFQLSDVDSLHSTSSVMEERLDGLVNAAPVFLFLHGEPTEPREADARDLIQLFREAGVGFSCFDLLGSPEVEPAIRARSGVIEGSILYVEGALFPVAEALALDSEALRLRMPESTRGMTEQEAVHEHCLELANSAHVVVFMKGTVEEPKCGFSNKMLTLLMSRGVKFGTVNILIEPLVRAEMKEISKWKTYPQLYVEGKFVGGLDVAKALDEEGELVPLIPDEALVRSTK